MSFSRAEIINIAKITGVDRIILQNHLALYPTEIDTTVQDDVRDEITRWTTAGVNFTSIEPNVRNFGARINPGDAKADIRKNIGNLLLLGDLMETSSGNWGYSKRA